MTPPDPNNNDNPPKDPKDKKRRINDITNELLEQLKDGPNDYFMALPMDESFEPTSSKKDTSNDVIEHIKSFQIKPKEVKTYLDRFVINQMEAKKALAIAICDHYNFVKEAINTESAGHYIKQNILMIGPTGVGKTYLIKRIAELIGVPFIKSDATKFTETGYQGGDVEDLVRQLYKKANNNIDLAEHGIIYLDEVDKITGTRSAEHKDVSGRGVQSNLLKIMEDTDVMIRPPWDIQGQIKQMMGPKKTEPDEKETINTKNILFIMSGAFNSLGDIIKKRLDGASIGFERKSTIKNTQDHDAYLKKLRTQDLVHFGLEPEFAGRLPVRVTLNQLNPADLYDILIKSEGSILEQYILSFQRFNIELAFNDDALHAISQLAHEEQIGARALPSTLEKIFRDFKFELPSTDVHYIFATKPLIKDPGSALNRYLKNGKKQLSIDIQSAINEKKTHPNQTMDTTKLMTKCLDPKNKGKITKTIDAFFYESTHVTPH
jgi:ATP-dependent Clp protease ATP-binding subunit ClpX